jgi:photosystem II stability/assembly factor-like uncharacterized protein
MKKKSVLLITAVLCFSTLSSAQWSHQIISNTQIYGFDIRDNTVVLGGWGGAPPTIGKSLYSIDRGITWMNSDVPDSVKAVKEIHIFDNNLVYGIGEILKTGSLYNFAGIFLQSTNGGQSFFRKGIIPDDVISLCKAAFLNPETGFVNAYTDIFTGGILKTTDGGFTWNWSYNYTTGSYIKGLSFYDTLNGFAFGYDTTTVRPVIIRTSDGGFSWVDIDFENCLTDIKAISSSRILASAISESGYEILLSTDNGVNWSVKMSVPPPAVISGLDGTENLLMAYGKINTDNSAVFISIDNGESWTQKPIYPLTAFTINDSKIINSSEWFFTATDLTTFGSYLLYTTNSGGTFTAVDEHKENYSSPSEFELFQNYPNPFNPSTTIQFFISSASNISFIIYDVLGREIYSVLNQYKSAGSHEINFNAHSIPAGVYFYELRGENFSQMKKMILMK